MKIIASILFPIAVLAFFLNSGFIHLQDDRAAEILKGSKEKFDSLADFSAMFRYGISSSRPDKKSTSISKEGTIRYKKGMFHIKMDDQEIYCDNQTQWIVLTEENEVSIMDYDPEESVNIESIFDLYETNAKARYDGIEEMNGNKYHKIYLSSMDQALDYNQIKLWINKDTRFLEKAVLIDRRQTITTMEFWDIRTNNSFSEASFRFDESGYPKMNVYDER
jgi:outer membrane lipoprotein-sorting protein